MFERGRKGVYSLKVVPAWTPSWQRMKSRGKKSDRDRILNTRTMDGKLPVLVAWSWNPELWSPNTDAMGPMSKSLDESSAGGCCPAAATTKRVDRAGS
jgi:hypothetical protein